MVIWWIFHGGFNFQCQAADLSSLGCSDSMWRSQRLAAPNRSAWCMAKVCRRENGWENYGDMGIKYMGPWGCKNWKIKTHQAFLIWWGNFDSNLGFIIKLWDFIGGSPFFFSRQWIDVIISTIKPRGGFLQIFRWSIHRKPIQSQKY